jgi:hypothetical protein
MKIIFWFLIGFFIGDFIDQIIFSKGIIARCKDLFVSYFSYKSAQNKVINLLNKKEIGKL